MLLISLVSLYHCMGSEDQLQKLIDCVMIPSCAKILALLQILSSSLHYF